MVAASPESVSLRELIQARRADLDAVLWRYGATNARLFGSVARGEADGRSDIDVMVDLLPDDKDSELLRISGIAVGMERVLGRRVDVVAPELLRAPVSKTAIMDAIPL